MQHRTQNSNMGWGDYKLTYMFINISMATIKIRNKKYKHKNTRCYGDLNIIIMNTLNTRDSKIRDRHKMCNVAVVQVS